jgi:hypothetical protein
MMSDPLLKLLAGTPFICLLYLHLIIADMIFGRVVYIYMLGTGRL